MVPDDTNNDLENLKDQANQVEEDAKAAAERPTGWREKVEQVKEEAEKLKDQVADRLRNKDKDKAA